MLTSSGVRFCGVVFLWLFASPKRSLTGGSAVGHGIPMDHEPTTPGQTNRKTERSRTRTELRSYLHGARWQPGQPADLELVTAVFTGRSRWIGPWSIRADPTDPPLGHYSGPPRHPARPQLADGHTRPVTSRGKSSLVHVWVSLIFRKWS